MFERIHQTTMPPPSSPASGADWSSDEFVARIEELVEADGGDVALDHVGLSLPLRRPA